VEDREAEETEERGPCGEEEERDAVGTGKAMGTGKAIAGVFAVIVRAAVRVFAVVAVTLGVLISRLLVELLVVLVRDNRVGLRRGPFGEEPRLLDSRPVARRVPIEIDERGVGAELKKLNHDGLFRPF